MCLMPNENSNLESKNFESLKYNTSDPPENSLLDNLCGRDSNYFSTAIKNFDTSYILPKEFYSQFKDHDCDTLSFLPINLVSKNRKFENYKLFLFSLGFIYI